MKKTFLFILIISLISISATNNTVKVAVLKYGGGGDWYGNPTSLPNLVEFANKNVPATIDPEVDNVEVGSMDLFNYPFVHMTGHGNVFFTNVDAQNLRAYLIGGGFLHIDDNYGIDKFIRREMKKVFPEAEFEELPINHPIYNQKYLFPKGIPKIHEHDGKPAQGFGIYYKDRLVCYYSYESDLGDGWEDADVHNDSEQARQKALQMGANILQYAFTH